MKKVILDNEWVLVKNDWDRVAKKIAEDFGLEQKSGKDLKQSFRLYDKGSDNILYQHNRGLLTPTEFWSQVLKSYDREASPENVQKISDAMALLTTDVDSGAINFITRLHDQGQPLYMLSNSTPDIFRGNRERHDYFDLFSSEADSVYEPIGVVVPGNCYMSFMQGFRKPEPEAYEIVLEENQFDPKDCVFVDDKDENLEGAEKAGITAVYHKIGDGTLEEKLTYLL